MAGPTVPKSVVNALIMQRRALIHSGQFRVKPPSPPSPFKLLRRRRMREQEQQSEFYNYLVAFEGKGKGDIWVRQGA